MSKDKKISKALAIDTLWRRAKLTWKLDANQVEMYEMVENTDSSIIVIGSSRQIGKTRFLVTLAVEFCLKNPKSIVIFIAPTIKDIKSITRAHMREVLDDCPRDLMPSYKAQDNYWSFKNGSEIQFFGTENGNADSARGRTANLVLVDEAGFCSDFDKVINEILVPTTTMTGGKIIMASTPPKSLDHPFIGFMRKAAFNGSYIKRTIYDNPRLSKEAIDKLAEAAGGYDSVGFRREYLVELITSDDDAIIPEFSKVKADTIKYWEKPPHFDTYVSLDIGGKDLTFAIFAYYDFQNAKIVIEDEVVIERRDMVSDYLAAQIKLKENERFINLDSGEIVTPKRVADNNNVVLLNDLQRKHGLMFVPTLKDDFDAALNNTRLLIKNKKVIINPRCKNLISHLESGIWNKSKTSFARSSEHGHFDGIAALIYLLRNINFDKNPFPADFAGDASFFRSKKITTPVTKNEVAISGLAKLIKTSPYFKRKQF